jgi:fumarate reductase flavoprotein subunit
LLDGRLAELYSAWPKFISTAPDIAYAYVKDYLKLRPDVTVQADSLESLMARRGIDLATVQATLRSFNRHLVGSEHDPFEHPGGTALLEKGPWLLLGPVKAYFTTTEGGAAVNEQLQVLDPGGQPIAGLYAAGQVGLGGMILWSHGLHIAWAMTSGKLAGESVAGV